MRPDIVIRLINNQMFNIFLNYNPTTWILMRNEQSKLLRWRTNESIRNDMLVGDTAPQKYFRVCSEPIKLQ